MAIKGPAIDQTGSWLIERDSVFSLLGRISQKIDDSHGQDITFLQCVRKLSSAGITICDIIGRIFVGSIIPTGLSNCPGLTQFLFCEEQLDEILEQVNKEKKDSILTAIDVAKILGIKQEVAAFWIDKGYIEGQRVEGQKVKRLVKPTAIDNFKSLYIPLAAIAKRFEVSPISLLNQLEKKAVYPISGPQVDGSRQYLFRVRDLSRDYLQ